MIEQLRHELATIQHARAIGCSFAHHWQTQTFASWSLWTEDFLFHTSRTPVAPSPPTKKKNWILCFWYSTAHFLSTFQLKEQKPSLNYWHILQETQVEDSQELFGCRWSLGETTFTKDFQIEYTAPWDAEVTTQPPCYHAANSHPLTVFLAILFTSLVA